MMRGGNESFEEIDRESILRKKKSNGIDIDDSPNVVSPINLLNKD